MSKTCQKQPKNHPTSQNIPKIIYIYLYFYGRALASSGRELDASKRSRHVATPKKRTLGLAPVIFCKVDVPKTRVQHTQQRASQNKRSARPKKKARSQTNKRARSNTNKTNARVQATTTINARSHKT